MKKWIIVLGIALVVSIAGNVALWINAADLDEKHTQALRCQDEAVELGNKMVYLYDTVVGYNNAGYLVDDYTAGTANVTFNAYNAGVDLFNVRCGSGLETI